MKIAKWQVTGLLFGLLFVGCGVAAESKYQQDTIAKQEVKQQKMQMKQRGMKQKAKSYGEVVLEQAETLDLTDEQLGKIMRIQMTNKKDPQRIVRPTPQEHEKGIKGFAESYRRWSFDP